MSPRPKSKLRVVIGGAAGARPADHPGNVWLAAKP